MHPGVFDLLFNGNKYPVWCEMSHEGGGWTTILRRTDGSVNFSSFGFTNYATNVLGFPDNEFMMSLSLLNALTDGTRNELDVTMSYNGVNYTSKYGLF